MFSLVEPSRSRAVSRLALAAALSAGIAGCSSDFSRMTENPWASKPQASHQGSAGSNEVTGSVRQSAPASKVERQPLAAPDSGGRAEPGREPAAGRADLWRRLRLGFVQPAADHAGRAFACAPRIHRLDLR